MSTRVPELAAAKMQTNPGGHFGMLSPGASAGSVLSRFARYPSDAAASHLATRSILGDGFSEQDLGYGQSRCRENDPVTGGGLMTELRGHSHGV